MSIGLKLEKVLEDMYISNLDKGELNWTLYPQRDAVQQVSWEMTVADLYCRGFQWTDCKVFRLPCE